MNISSMFNSLGQVYRSSLASDSIGATERTRTATGEAFLCRIRMLSGTERQVAGARGVDLSHRIYCSASVDVTEEDEITIGSKTYRVETVNDVDLTGELLQIDCRETRPDRNGR